MYLWSRAHTIQSWTNIIKPDDLFMKCHRTDEKANTVFGGLKLFDEDKITPNPVGSQWIDLNIRSSINEGHGHERGKRISPSNQHLNI